MYVWRKNGFFLVSELSELSEDNLGVYVWRKKTCSVREKSEVFSEVENMILGSIFDMPPIIQYQKFNILTKWYHYFRKDVGDSATVGPYLK